MGIQSLPAMKHLADLAKMLPVIIIDTREQDPLPFSRLPTIRAGLHTGDYSVAGLQESFAVERKSVPDLVGCCMGANRERLERELVRLRGLRFRRLIVVGNKSDIQEGKFWGKLNPKSVLASLSAWEVRFDVPVVWADTPAAAGLQVESWAWWYSRDVVASVNALYRGAKAVSGTVQPKTLEPPSP